MTRQDIVLQEINPQIVTRTIGDFIAQTVRESAATGAVIGLSGGVDSTTTAAIARDAFAKENAAHNTNFELVGYILPSSTNNPKDTEDGIKVAKRLGIRYEVHNLQPLVESYAATNPEAIASKYDKGNLTSRIRATVLNTKAATEKKVLLGTGNRDEDVGIGYYTLFGDGAVHCSPIAGLSKRHVRQVAEYLGFSDLAHREPTAGLEDGQTDFKDLGYRYDMVELYLAAHEQGLSDAAFATHPRVTALFAQQQQQYAAAFGVARYDSPAAMTHDLARRHHIAQQAAIIHPPTPRIPYLPADLAHQRTPAQQQEHSRSVRMGGHYAQ